MSLRDQLYQDVLAHPDKDGPRRRYAEHLEQQGDELGEYIRLSLERVRHGLDRDLYLRMLELHSKLQQQQTAPLEPWIRSDQRDRGLVSLVEMTGHSFLDHGAEVFARAPIQHLDLVDAKAVFASVVQNPLLERVQTLNLANNDLGDTEAELLASSPHVRRLVWLDLFNNKIGMRGLEAIASSSNLPSLRMLGFDYNRVASPVSMSSNDGVSGLTHYEGAGATQAPLEQKYGSKRWMHPSESEQNLDRFRFCDAGE